MDYGDDALRTSDFFLRLALEKALGRKVPPQDDTPEDDGERDERTPDGLA